MKSIYFFPLRWEFDNQSNVIIFIPNLQLILMQFFIRMRCEMLQRSYLQECH